MLPAAPNCAAPALQLMFYFIRPVSRSSGQAVQRLADRKRRDGATL